MNASVIVPTLGGGERLRRGLTADDDHGDGMAVVVADAVEQLAAVHQRHQPVEQHDVRLLVDDPLQRLGPVRCELHFEAALVEADGVKPPDVGVVIDDQNAPSHAHIPRRWCNRRAVIFSPPDPT